jgi:hypothetical protein
VPFVPFTKLEGDVIKGHTSSVTVSASAGSMKVASEQQMREGVMGLGRIGSKSRGKI